MSEARKIDSSNGEELPGLPREHAGHSQDEPAVFAAAQGPAIDMPSGQQMPEGLPALPEGYAVSGAPSPLPTPAPARPGLIERFSKVVLILFVVSLGAFIIGAALATFLHEGVLDSHLRTIKGLLEPLKDQLKALMSR